MVRSFYLYDNQISLGFFPLPEGFPARRLSCVIIQAPLLFYTLPRFDNVFAFFFPRPGFPTNP